MYRYSAELVGWARGSGEASSLEQVKKSRLPMLFLDLAGASRPPHQLHR